MDIGVGLAILIIGLLGLFAFAPKQMLVITVVLAGLGAGRIYMIHHQTERELADDRAKLQAQCNAKISEDANDPWATYKKGDGIAAAAKEEACKTIAAFEAEYRERAVR